MNVCILRMIGDKLRMSLKILCLWFNPTKVIAFLNLIHNILQDQIIDQLEMFTRFKMLCVKIPLPRIPILLCNKLLNKRYHKIIRVRILLNPVKYVLSFLVSNIRINPLKLFSLNRYSIKLNVGIVEIWDIFIIGVRLNCNMFFVLVVVKAIFYMITAKNVRKTT